VRKEKPSSVQVCPSLDHTGSSLPAAPKNSSLVSTSASSEAAPEQTTRRKRGQKTRKTRKLVDEKAGVCPQPSLSLLVPAGRAEDPVESLLSYHLSLCPFKQGLIFSQLPGRARSSQVGHMLT
jgi:hypothetical protein